jgi:hypothetical protein
MPTLPVFTPSELQRAKILLATQVASMMGRKLEEGDWSRVYCKAKEIPEVGWSNLHIDVSHKGLGLELKLLRVANLQSKPLKSVCGTALMHPAATRSIRIERTNLPANKVMAAVFEQYGHLIEQRTDRVRSAWPGTPVDMRTGWLIWEDNLAEFLYFEEPMVAPNPDRYFAEWNDTPARGARKASRSLWVYDKKTKQKRYSITTSAGIKIQPYFDVPTPSDRHLCYFRVQSEPIGRDTVCLWIAASTAAALKDRLGSLDRAVVSAAILKVLAKGVMPAELTNPEQDLAIPVRISTEAHTRLLSDWEAVSDEHRAQLLLKALS